MSSSLGSEEDWWFCIVVVTEIKADSKLDNLPVMISTDWNKININFNRINKGLTATLDVLISYLCILMKGIYKRNSL